MADDEFEPDDLPVAVIATDRPIVCGHREGDWSEVTRVPRPGRGPR